MTGPTDLRVEQLVAEGVSGDREGEIDPVFLPHPFGLDTTGVPGLDVEWGCLDGVEPEVDELISGNQDRELAALTPDPVVFDRPVGGRGQEGGDRLLWGRRVDRAHQQQRQQDQGPAMRSGLMHDEAPQ